MPSTNTSEHIKARSANVASRSDLGFSSFPSIADVDPALAPAAARDDDFFLE